MLILFSHVLAFSVLFVAAIFDLKTSEVPDSLSLVGVTGGILLHLGASLQQGINFTALADLPLLLAEPFTWLNALGEPLLWSLGVGTAFSLYGWGLYFTGMWGGADAFAMSILGFAAPYSLSGPGVVHAANLFVSILVAGFVYTLGFALYHSYRNKEIWSLTFEKIQQQERSISLEVLAAAIFSMIGSFSRSFNTLAYFGIFVSMIFLYRFLKVVQEVAMHEEVSVENLEAGQVVETEELDGKIRGIKPEEIENLEAEKVKVTSGVRFVPVFPIALVLTDVFGVGVKWVVLLLN